MGEVFNVPSKPNINYYPLEIGHTAIGAMSLSFVAPGTSQYVDCSISSGDSQSIGTPQEGHMTGAVPILNSDFIESRSAHNNENYGVIELVNMIERTACDMAWTGVKLSLGDASKGQERSDGTQGHDINDHESHNSGRDVDTRLYAYSNGQYFMKGQLCDAANRRCVENGVSSLFNNENALEANYKYIKSLHRHGDVQYVAIDGQYQKLLDDYASRKYSESSFSASHNLADWVNHHHHYHIRIHCPEGDSQCSG